MIFEWFKRDVDTLLAQNNRVVIVDPGCNAGFLVDNLKSCGAYHICSTTENSDVEELKIKYELEKNHENEKAIIYTSRKLDQLSFIRDYCETHGCIDFTRFYSYITGKLHSELGENVNMQESDLLILVKKSIGKDEKWWHKMLHKLDEVFEPEEVVQFLDDPEGFSKKLDTDVLDLFYKKINDLIGQSAIDKPPRILADELAKCIFSTLADNTIGRDLYDIYRRWADSSVYEKSLQRYVHDFKVNQDVDCWQAHPDHCFPDIDRKCLMDINKNLSDNDYLNEKIKYIEKRTSARNSWCIPVWWKEILHLLTFDTKKIDSVVNLKALTEYYLTEFYKYDRAIRILYAEMLNDKDLLSPWQQQYEYINRLYLEKWFKYFEQYKETQSEFLKNLIISKNIRTAIIVGDGIRYEIAMGIAEKLKGYYKFDEKFIYSDLPSETENNMSALYIGNGIIESTPKKREEYLSNNTGRDIQFIELDNLNSGITSDILVLNCRDIDSLGEKLQQKALKMFDELEYGIAEKIKLIFQAGYKNIYLTSDHGFVLTGLLSESDKIEVDFKGKIDKNERYIRAVEKQHLTDNLIEVEKKYADYQYIYFAKNHRPFKTTGQYGYSHGGITPQELIVPCFHITPLSGSDEKLKVEIQNKKELQSVAGNNFRIKISASTTGNIFFQSRDIQLIFIDDIVEIKRSDVIAITADQNKSIEYDIKIKETMSVILIDAQSKEQLDKAEIKMNKARDLGGLI